MPEAGSALADKITLALSSLLPERVEELRETHLSLVLLTKNYAFKLKKPAKYDFVDHSTFAKRWTTACHEINLNRRLSSGVYLGLLHARLDGAAEYSLGCVTSTDPADTPQHTNHDHVLVVMRRLREDEMLLGLVQRQSPELPHLLSALGASLASFHACNRVDSHSWPTYNADLIHYVRQNIAALHQELKRLGFAELYFAILERLAQKEVQVLNTHSALFAQRLQQGLVVNGHGDLHLEHVFWSGRAQEPVLQIIDCLEFNPELRRCDSASDLGFLLMDLERHKRPDLAAKLLREYLGHSSDRGIVELLPFFKCYRALVRAKVHCLRAEQLLTESGKAGKEAQSAAAYFSLASSYLYELRTPVLVLVCGLMGTGKSSLAGSLSTLFFAESFNSDLVRKELFAAAASDAAKSRQAPFGAGIYTAAATESTYNELLQLAEQRLKFGNSVILDATFGSAETRARARAVAQRNQAALIIVECKLSKELTLKRLQDRLRDSSRISDARPELLEVQSAAWEEVLPEEADLYLCADTEQSLPQLALQLADKIGSSNLRRQID